jgi:RimJ/RimL family protein N-acetyltransferase
VAEFGLMVAADARRQGIGSIALYRKLGFEEEGLLRRRYFINGRYIDAMLMGLDLDKVEA